ncbi:MAG: cation:proton antiporter family protein [Dehalococcoidia bacterium]|nr:cation:proton antiporter family protein [Dehalococcoidia bacterium]
MLELENQFYELGAILGIAALVGIAGILLRQPLIVSFIAVGILVGPAWLDIASGSEGLELLAEVGIALLLFVVGLKLDLHVIRTMGRVALLTGLGQVLFTSVVGFGLSLALGYDVTASLYIAIALTFSSTIIIVKLLSDKREIDSLHGRVAVGFLIVQDIVVVLTMIAISAFGTGDEANPMREAGLVVARGAAMLAAVALLMRWVIPRIMPFIARSPELLILVAISWAVGLAVVGDGLGFSKEVGAFLAGVSLASTPYREAIGGRLIPLRDFLLLFFFVNLGASFELAGIGEQILPATVLSLFVLVGNPLIVVIIMGAMGYRKRTGFLSGLAVAQISEFSLIFAALGVSLGHIEESTLGLVTLVGLVTIGLSTYLIMYSHQVYAYIGRFLDPFERHGVPHPEDEDGELPLRCDVIVFGLGRYGEAIAEGLRNRGYRVLGVDFDPELVRRYQAVGLLAHYGDAEDAEFIRHLPIHDAKWVISSAPTVDTNLTLLDSLRSEGYRGRIALTARSTADTQRLLGRGVDVVLRPFRDAAVRAIEEITGIEEDIPEAAR